MLITNILIKIHASSRGYRYFSWAGKCNGALFMIVWGKRTPDQDRGTNEEIGIYLY